MSDAQSALFEKEPDAFAFAQSCVRCAGDNSSRIILSLCDFSGNWPYYYKEAGYDVRCIDLKRGQDVRMLEYVSGNVYGILAAPDCTAFAGSGAQYWQAKDERGATKEALALVDACLRAVAIYKPKFWALENPVGRLRRWLGAPRYYFHPFEFGGHADGMDAYTKKTCLWGEFNDLEKRPVEPARACSQGSWLQKLGGKSARTKELRSMTPLGFARAFFLANQ